MASHANNSEQVPTGHAADELLAVIDLQIAEFEALNASYYTTGTDRSQASQAWRDNLNSWRAEIIRARIEVEPPVQHAQRPVLHHGRTVDEPIDLEPAEEQQASVIKRELPEEPDEEDTEADTERARAAKRPRARSPESSASSQSLSECVTCLETFPEANMAITTCCSICYCKACLHTWFQTCAEDNTSPRCCNDELLDPNDYERALGPDVVDFSRLFRQSRNEARADEEGASKLYCSNPTCRALILVSPG